MMVSGINSLKRANTSTFGERRTSVHDINVNANKEKNTAKNDAPNDEVTKDKINSFDDKKLANILGIGSGTTISTQKPINWEADGTSQLTEEQIDYLKSNYDIKNMSEQDYYDLMADLTNMNVLSGDDVKSQHVAPIVMGASAVASVGIGEGEYGNFQGNLLSNVHSSLQNYTDRLYALHNKNWHYSGQNIQQASNDLLSQKLLYEKISSIYDLIERQ